MKCIPCGTVTYTYPIGCPPNTVCTLPLASTSVVYSGPNLPNTGIQTNMTLTEALQRIDDIINGEVVDDIGGVWGAITGLITDQSDLIAYLLANYAPLSRTLTINGVTFDLSANRSWTTTDPAVIFSTLTGDVKSIKANTDVVGPGTVTVTNGSATVTGTGTTFTDATSQGVSYWFTIHITDSAGTEYRILLASVTNNTTATILSVYTPAQIFGTYPAASALFPGVTGTYTYKITKHYSSGNFSTAFGNNAYARDFGTAFGAMSAASGQTSFAIGSNTIAAGSRSFAGGFGNFATTGDRRTRAGGISAFNFSVNDSTQTIGHGAGANYSAILGGQNHDIPSTAVNSAIIGGQLIKVGASITHTVHLPKLRIGLGTSGTILTDDALTNILVRDATTGEVKLRTVASLPTGSGITGLTANRVPYATSATTLGDNAAFTWDNTNNALTIDGIRIHATAGFNTFIGNLSGNFTLTGTQNTVLGDGALPVVTSGAFNTIVGVAAAASLTDGSENTIIGRSAMSGGAATSVTHNVMIGAQAGATTNFAGSQNVMIGAMAGANFSTCNENVLIGYLVGASLTTGDKNVAIGSQINLQSTTATGQLTIQNIIFGTGNTATTTTVSTGNIGIGGPPVADKFEIWHSGTQLLGLTTDGRLYGKALHNNAGDITGTTNQYIASGTYTPTVANQANTSSLSADVAQFIRVGNVVTVSGQATLDYTSGGLAAFTISLPIASNFTDSTQCSGVAIKIIGNFTHADIHGTIEGGVASNLAAVFFPARGAETTMTMKFTFTYLIL